MLLPADEFNFDAFHVSRYTAAMVQRRRAEDLSAVLYLCNDDETECMAMSVGQEFFSACASMPSWTTGSCRKLRFPLRRIPGGNRWLRLVQTGTPGILFIMMAIDGVTVSYWEAKLLGFGFQGDTSLPCGPSRRWSLHVRVSC